MYAALLRAGSGLCCGRHILLIGIRTHTDFVLFGTYSHSTWIRQQGSSPYGTLLANPNGPVSPRMFTGDPSLGTYDVEQYTVGYNLQHRFANGMVIPPFLIDIRSRAIRRSWRTAALG